MNIKCITRAGKYLVLTAAFLFTTFSTARAVEDAIIAIVNDEVITLKDLRDYIRKSYLQLMAENIPENELKQIQRELETNGLNKLIEDKLILTRANELGIEINEKLVDDRIAEIKSHYDSEDDFMKALIDHGGTPNDLRNKILDQLKIKFVVDHEVKSKIYVNPQEVTRFYEDNIDNFQKKESVRLDSVFIARTSPDAKAKAEAALKDIRDGKKFADVIKQYSDAPSIGTVERGQLIPELEDKIFRLNVNDVSDLVEVESGYYIFKMTGRIPSEMATLEEVKESIYRVIYRTKFQEEFTAWLEKLKKKSYIEIK